jgi:hypothetical protein
MDAGAISFGNHQGPVVMKEAHFGGVDDNVSTTFMKDVNTRRVIILLSSHSQIFLL